MRKSISLFLLLVGLGACEPPNADTDAEPGETGEALTANACLDDAQAKAKAWTAAGVAPKEVEVRTQALIVKCLGTTDSATARFIGAVRVDMFRASRQMVAGSSTPSEFVLRARDRGAKAKLARNTAGYVAAYARGDADGDLVPDDRDRCPGTPDLQPTDPSGCPQQPPRASRPVAPDGQQMQAILRQFNLAVDPRCDGAPMPTTPRPIKTGYWDAAANVVVTQVTNQPAGCLVLYEIDARFENQNWKTTGQLAPKYPAMALRAAEATPMAGLPAGQLRFKVLSSDPRDLGNRRIYAGLLGQYELVDWRVRAINGNGQKSSWSDWQKLRYLAPL